MEVGGAFVTFSSDTIIDRQQGTSEFHYRVNGSIERTLTLGEYGYVRLPAFTAPVTMALDDFTEVVNGVQRWQERTRAVLKFTAAAPSTARAVGFSVGAQGADGTYATSSSIEFEGGTMPFTYTPGGGVEFAARPELNLRWDDLALRNALSFDMITAALTGQRPRPGASIIGPRGQAGPKGDTGAQGPPAPYRQREIAIAVPGVNMNLVGDTPLSIPFALWRIVELLGYSPSVNLSTTARIGLYTAPAASGSTLITPTLVNLNLNENDAYTIAPAQKRTVQQAGTVYLRNTQAFGSAATCSFQLTIRDLGV